MDRYDDLSRCNLAIRFLSSEHLELLAENIRLEQTKRLRQDREQALAEGKLLCILTYDTGAPRHVAVSLNWAPEHARAQAVKALCGEELTHCPVLVIEGQMWGSAPKAEGTVTCAGCLWLLPVRSSWTTPVGRPGNCPT